MRLDRHERLSRSLNNLRSFLKNFWDQEVSKCPNYCLDIKAVAPRYQLVNCDYNKAARYRSVEAFVHWLALQNLLRIIVKETDKAVEAYVKNVFSFPEITIIGQSITNTEFSSRLIVPFTVSTMYQKPEHGLAKYINTSWILGCNEVDLSRERWFDVREEISEFETEGDPSNYLGFSEEFQTIWMLLFLKSNHYTI